MTIEQILALAVQAFAAIRIIVQNDALDDAAVAVSAIAAIYHAVDSAQAQKITPDQAAQAIRDLVGELAANDAAADAALAAKFPRPDDPGPGG